MKIDGRKDGDINERTKDEEERRTTKHLPPFTQDARKWPVKKVFVSEIAKGF